MKIAIINNGVSAGGLRFEASLIRGLRLVRPDWQITYFTDISLFREDIIKQELINNSVEIHDYRSLDIKLNKPELKTEFQGLGSVKLSSFNVLLFTWPYDFCCPDLQMPILFIPHDFNFFYFFESLSFSKEYADAIHENLSGFFSGATPVVSTEFIRNEVAKFFPEFAAKTNVVPVAVMSNLQQISEQEQEEILKKFALKPIYFLYPCSSVKPYKNLGILAAAIYHLKNQGIDAQIVYIGSNTEKICGDAIINGVRQDFANIANCNVRGLGFVTDKELVALMGGAQAVVTSSLYEAANGPAIDAWSSGVPVAMSDLPFYTEHLASYDVRAVLFDPKNVFSVVDALKYIISNQKQVSEEAAYSKEQIQKTTSLADFAIGYAKLIEGLANG